MKNQDKLTWYEVAVDIIPNKKNNRKNYFYVSVSRWEKWEEFDNARFNYDPFVGNYENRREFNQLTRGRDDIQHIIVADTLIDLDSALKLEEYLVKGFMSDNKENGFNKQAEKAGD